MRAEVGDRIVLKSHHTGERDQGWEVPEVKGADGGSDLGRRLIRRREELGLSIEKVAAGASIDPGYLSYLETAADPDPPRSTLWRLAAVLQTSPTSLRGGGHGQPPGRRRPGPEPRLEEMGREECFALIAPGGVGRFIFLEGRGPVAVPVNFRMLGHDVVFRTTATSSLSTRAGQLRVSFEVDHIDEAMSEGWSVLLSGTGHRVEDPAERAEVEALGIEPWAGGHRDTYYRLRPEEVTGRRIEMAR
jgi:nitroimidazol reductase NimA-like FMN-containing flavoprotein (pyridoxamine 5'-phosphate oxidase superfamily)